MDSANFIAALRTLEQAGQGEELVELYDEGAHLENPHVSGELVGPEGARRFWSGYRAASAEVRSEFRVVLEGDGQAALEWTSTGTPGPGGQPLRYAGVTVLEWSGDRPTRSSAYFDPRAIEAAVTAQDGDAHGARDEPSTTTSGPRGYGPSDGFREAS